MDDDKRIQVMELFGPTIQGEGLMSGTVTHFLRTGGCPLRCEWCDSWFAVDPKLIQKHRTLMTTWEIIDAILALPWAPYVTFTGGDPAIQQRLGDIIPALNQNGMRVAIETQAMYFPTWLGDCDVVTFSPKGPSSGNEVNPQGMIDWLLSGGKRRRYRVCIKVVCFTKEDFRYAMRIFEKIPMMYYDAFYFTAGTPLTNMDEFENEEALREAAATKAFAVLQNQHNVAEWLLQASRTVRFNEKTHIGCQQHVLLWPDKDKGV